MKRYILIGFMIFTFILVPHNNKAEAKTLQDIYLELNALEKKLNEQIDSTLYSEEKIKEIKDEIIEIGILIEEKEAEVTRVEQKKEEYQITKNNLIYQNELLELYASFTAPIISELNVLIDDTNITNVIYNNTNILDEKEKTEEEIKETDKLISINEQENVELENTKLFLQEQEQKLLVEQDKLGSLATTLDENAIDLKRDIEIAKSTIENYEKMGCKRTDYLDECSSIKNDNRFVRPLFRGRITSEYGIRFHPTKKTNLWHHAVDIGGNPVGTSVYAIARGTVVAVNYVKNPEIPNSSCGGNMLVIQHKIGDTYYASRYMHMSKISVTVGQQVDINTIVGEIGGNEIYDSCSTGAHLDLAIAKGIYAQDFYSFRVPYTVNPRLFINFPQQKEVFEGRY